ncbi:hypothetical protein HRR82_000837 [Exophiala dermatitidis]|nr:hypothetical protein HRR82_000837 [Exophiala dermatitidis]
MSAEQDSDVYDFERDFLLPSRSPLLEVARPNLKPEPSPPRQLVPFYPSSSCSSEDEDASNGRGSTRRRRNPKGPNYPIVAGTAERHALASASQSEAEEESVLEVEQELREDHDDEFSAARPAAPKAFNRTFRGIVVTAAQIKSDKHDDFPMIDSPMSVTTDDQVRSPAARPQNGSDDGWIVRQLPGRPSSRQEMSTRSWHMELPRLSPPRRQPFPEAAGGEEESIASSPTIGRYAITPRDIDPDVILPAMHRSSPRLSPAGSPQQKPILPPLSLAIGNIQEVGPGGRAAMFPVVGRPSPIPIHHSQPSPCWQSPQSVMSPPGLPFTFASQSSTQGRSRSIASEITSVTSVTSATVSTPATSETMAASVPSSIASPPKLRKRRRGKNSQQQSVSSQSTSKEKQAMDSGTTIKPSLPETTTSLVPVSSNTADSAPVRPANYECTVAGCTAAPFHTLYLLNSHMNVHSEKRTHFCSVKGCPRGPGGTGFKRKNEMMRHALVHAPPIYVCPFCPDQQHKYPRPDNLQRHVRAHHKDRDRNDPELLAVLDRRPDGAERPTKRRTQQNLPAS